MINFVGAGPGAKDLITLRGKELLEKAHMVIYAGSLVNPELLEYCKAECEIYNSAEMTLGQIMQLMINAHKKGLSVVRLHTGDPAVYGAIKEQMNILDNEGIEYSVCPGVSSLFGCSAALKAEYTLPEISQTLIVTRMAGRTPVPEKENIPSLAAHNASMVIFLSTGLLDKLSQQLIQGGYDYNTPAAIVYKATWDDEKVVKTCVGELYQAAKENNITKTALIAVGNFLKGGCTNSKLYSPYFTHEYRRGTDSES